MVRRFAARPGFGPRASAVTGIALVLLAAAVLIARLPGTVSRLDGDAKRNDAFTTLGRALAAADSFDIDNGFVVAAMNLPPRTTFAILTPVVAPAGISPATINALTPYLQYLLLPSRLSSSDRAAYLLCYLCDRRAVHARVTWTSTGGSGLFIGRVRGRP